ncbi:plant self-incompatibility protein S1 family [Striga asiatica]|uniref:Plant self-incompatibility protein S1 family n=1 Tax=Striga asiatica TaxID=4170 RepID=A0A5A7P3X7_STRAF|nr:plant self-incompatibility protein S1 family [Striga asiatica]
MAKSLFFTLILLFMSIMRPTHSCFWRSNNYTISIFDSILDKSDNIWFHCASKDNDLGNHTLNRGFFYYWSFCTNFQKTTMFFCRFHWGPKQRAFEVFNYKLGKRMCKSGTCLWSVADNDEYTISINNNIADNKSDKISFHCASKDNDLGNHTLNGGSSYKWSFCNNILKRTMFFCRFHWGPKQRAFEVFNYKLGVRMCKDEFCNWYVQNDGFYLSGLNTTMAKNLFFTLILIFMSIMRPTQSCFWTKGYTISIYDGILDKSDKISLHCASKDDDLGNHTLKGGFNYDWSFCDSYWKTTMFFCHFYWGHKERAFEVFNYNLGKHMCKSGTCTWSVANDGFYLRDGRFGTPFKQYDWQNNTAMAKNFFFTVILLFMSIMRPTHSCFWTKGYTISIYNNILDKPDKISFHCASKDDDLGNHTLIWGFSYDWSFCDNYWKTTMFFCHFYWGSKERAFEVYNYNLGKHMCKSGTCIWTVANDGFYLRDDRVGKPFKQYDWQKFGMPFKQNHSRNGSFEPPLQPPVKLILDPPLKPVMN